MSNQVKYKETTLLWCPLIPENWDVCKLKHLVKVKDGTHDSPITISPNEFSYPLITSKDINNGEIDFSDARHISATDHNKIVQRSNVTLNDVIMPMIGTVGGAAVVQTIEPFSIKNVALFKTSESKLSPVYLRYLLDSNFIKSQFEIVARGGVQNFVSLDILKNLYVPKNEEQDKIASFLDDRTAEIDIIISQKLKLIDCLQEEKQVLIDNIVTQGVDKNVRLKYSGIEWIGEIPEEWNIKRLKFNTYIKARVGWHGLKSDEFYFEGEGAFCITGTDFKNKIINWDKCYKVPFERYDEDPYIQLKEDDLLITKDGTIGKVALVKNLEGKATLNSGVFVVRPKNEDYINEYLYWILQSKVMTEFVNLTSRGSTIIHLYQDTFQNMFIPIPSIEEQKQIVDFLDFKTAEIDKIIKRIEREIELINEYRTSLINEVVTGKITLN